MTNLRYDRDPFETLLRLQDEVARSLSPRTSQPREHVSTRVWTPQVDVFEDSERIVISADLPGVLQENIDIEMDGDTLVLRGERKFDDEAQRDKYVRVERQYGPFQRSFTIGVPIEADRVKATYRNGILELTIPKSEAVRPKKVVVQMDEPAQ